MHTYFLGQEEVIAYARDLAWRLEALATDFPRVWCPLGISGQKLAGVVADNLPEALAESVTFVRISSDRDTRQITWIDSNAGVDFSGPVLLIDSAIHSGQSMIQAVEALKARGATDIITYSLVTKCGAEFVPNYFGVLIDDHDRAYFQLQSIPNNRLQSQKPFGTLRTLRQSDVDRPFLATGLGSMDKGSYADLLYEHVSRGTNVYVYEHNDEIVGFLSFEHRGRTVFVDAVGSDVDYRGKNVGGLLIRWAETWARNQRCDFLELWAVESAVKIYTHLGFQLVAGQTLDLGGERYSLMRRKLLYNIKPEVA